MLRSMMVDLLPGVSGWIAAAFAAMGSFALLRRRLSKDKTELAKDQAERTFIALMLAERDQAIAEKHEAWRVRQVDVESIARLTSQNLYQQEEIERLVREFATFKGLIARLYPDTRRFLESDFAELDDLAKPRQRAAAPFGGGRRRTDPMPSKGGSGPAASFRGPDDDPSST